MKNINVITFTNYGYLKFTLNLLNSIKHNSIGIDLKIYCTDDRSKNYLDSIGQEAILLDSQVKSSQKFLTWKAGINEFGKFMFHKFESIFDSLQNNEYTLYVDGDIVIKEQICDFLLDNIKNNDFLFQLDYNPKKSLQNEACAGFMFIKSTNETRDFFNPKNININDIVELPSHDQTYINLEKNNFNYNFLPEVYFPNGAFFYNFVTHPKIIHFNYVVGKKKIKTMKKYGEWYKK